MSGLAIAGDIAYYRAQPSWRQYLAYHNARSTLLGTARGESNEIPAAVLEHVGWSANDLSMMYSYFGVNETVFSLDHQHMRIDYTGSWRWPFDSRSFETDADRLGCLVAAVLPRRRRDAPRRTNHVFDCNGWRERGPTYRSCRIAGC